MRAELSGIDGVTVRDLGRNPSAIVSFTIEAIDAADIVRKAHEGDHHWLLQSPRNADRLLKAVAELEAGGGTERTLTE